MDDDFRELARIVTDDLDRRAKQFPLLSPGANALTYAARKLRLHYIWGTPQKSNLILQAIRRGHRRIDDITKSTGLSRRAVCRLLTLLVEREYVVEGREPSAGRHFRSFTLSDKLKTP